MGRYVSYMKKGIGSQMRERAFCEIRTGYSSVTGDTNICISVVALYATCATAVRLGSAAAAATIQRLMRAYRRARVRGT